ncbi:glycerate kinase [Diaphorobacter aerolatus]|uniref:Glycerate kinase n=1 Tax=Diaphorobacter aerolatus TaxID=1288495 RepID=A0A7H0GFU7_9BURK|nr:glycerate kinase [Diaphorobacter aerolatus]QNP47163.1 glycerate kinase [Diaphorobacter aerolatus]
MNFRKYLIPIGIACLFIASYNAWGWQGPITVLGGVVMWGLLHYTRMMNVMQKANKSPIGYVGSAVMLNAKLRPGVNLLHVVAMTRSLGELLTPEGTDPERYRWTDGTRSFVDVEFVNGRVTKWELTRPQQPEDHASERPTDAISPTQS